MLGSTARRASVLLATALLALVAAGTARTARADSPATFPDAAGDANGGPDITGVTVTNDANGMITMNISVALAPTSALWLFMDTDLNGQVADATGRSILVISAGEGLVLPQAFANDANGDPQPTDLPSLNASSTASSVTLSFAKTDVGIDKGFGFWIGTFASPDALVQGNFADQAPDQAMCTYILTSPPPSSPPPSSPPATTPPAVAKPVIGDLVGTPSAHAGKRFRAAFAVTRSDDGAPLTGATATCRASVAARTVPCTGSFAKGSARVSLLVPKTSKGKLLKVRLTVKAGGQSAGTSASFRID